MDDVGVRVQLLRSDASLPQRAHPYDAGADLVTPLNSHYTVPSGQWRLIPTGIAISVPEGYVGLLHPRSGLAAKHGVTVLNAPGTIDAGFTGEVKVILFNHGSSAYTVKPGTRVAQLIIQRVELPNFTQVVSLGETARATAGFGSTGGM